MNVPRILAVDPGRRMLGVAVFEGASLRYYAIKTLQAPGTPKEVSRAAANITNSLIRDYRPTHLAIEQPLVVQQRAELLAHVIDAIKTTARRRRLHISEYAPQAVRRSICTDAKPTKREVARRLAIRFPELNRYAHSHGGWAELYYQRMFGAIAVGLVAYAVCERGPVEGKSSDTS